MQNLKSDLIKLLSDNAKYTNKQLASITGSTEKEVEVAVKELENDGVIVKYAAIINDSALPESIVQALIEVKVAPQKLKGFDS